jgi:dihydroflavonol-4-reductase
MTILVTGASGHVGGNLVRALLDRGERVRAMVHRNTRALEGLDVERVPGDVTDPSTLAPAMADVDRVFHLAAMISIDGSHGGLVERINVGGTRNVAEAALAAGVRRFVHFSSVHAFSQTPLGEPLDETRAKVSGRGAPAYDRSKAAAEAELREVIAKGLDAVIVNPAGIIGPYDFAPSRMGQVFVQLRRGRLAALTGGGFNWVDVRDAVAGAIAASERGRSGENYLLPGHQLSIREIAERAGEIAGFRPPRFDVPLRLAEMAAPFALGFSRLTRQTPLFTPESLTALRSNPRIVSDKARDDLGYQPRPIDETLRDIYLWLEEAGLIEAA